ncbi:MAG TPA: hypothetical protein VGD98_06620 [Ktedonobacteraceae bacterium]
MFMPVYDKESRQLVNKARTLGTGALSINLQDHELLRLCVITATDLDKRELVKDVLTQEEKVTDYYSMPLEWFNRPTSGNANFVEIFLLLKQNIVDFATYFEKLCELHKRRLKFKMLLEHQAFPQMEQIVPRCLLEYGLKPSETLASWLVWRKWLYDRDNRSAQETGYLFEPILSAAIGGIPFASRKSPIKRTHEPSRGGQVDCLDGKMAYEFKMRVTIAASGQGRFKEELDFAQDCFNSGYTPIFLVLDPTPSTRLDELKSEYKKYHGDAYIGNDAWLHIEEKAGEVMGKFVEKYVKVPLKEVDVMYRDLQLVQIIKTNSAINIRVGNESFSISRTEPQIDYGDAEEDRDLYEG